MFGSRGHRVVVAAAVTALLALTSCTGEEPPDDNVDKPAPGEWSTPKAVSLDDADGVVFSTDNPVSVEAFAQRMGPRRDSSFEGDVLIDETATESHTFNLAEPVTTGSVRIYLTCGRGTEYEVRAYDAAGTEVTFTGGGTCEQLASATWPIENGNPISQFKVTVKSPTKFWLTVYHLIPPSPLP